MHSLDFYHKYVSLHFRQISALKWFLPCCAIDYDSRAQHTLHPFPHKRPSIHLWPFRAHRDPKDNLVERNTQMLAVQSKGPGSTQPMSCSFLISLRIHACGSSALLSSVELLAVLKRLIHTPGMGEEALLHSRHIQLYHGI